MGSLKRMRASVLVAGIVVLIIGIIVAAVGSGTAAILGTGIVTLIIGIAIAGFGTAVGRSAPRRGVREPAMGGSAMGAGGMESMVRMLADAPEAQRREMIKTRLISFADMNDSERLNSMRVMMAAAQKLDGEAVRRLTYSRLESLAEDFDPATRKKLMGTHMMMLMGLPKEQMMSEMNAMISVMGQCHDACRMKDMNAMKDLLMEMPEEKRKMMMDMMSPSARQMMMGGM